MIKQRKITMQKRKKLNVLLGKLIILIVPANIAEEKIIELKTLKMS